MSFFISDAYAAAASPSPGGDPIVTIVMFVAIIGFFWFFLIRPQQKKQKEHQKLLSALSKGDEVVTSGGMLGRITEVGDQFITIEVASGVQVRIQKQAVGNVMPKGTIKNL
ncbi:MAG TPA: preprotein translocase subunit YajC [Gammaproteobacteria bacterium]|jgi:preprotein translocase subunit YajC|nr:preprotein translocase subunit YajC [Gammaproteobacteria bacterium]